MTATARIEVFRTGRFTPMSGAPLSFSAADLRAVADSYDPETAPAPLVVGHPQHDAPAFGWVQSFDFDAKADRLFANVAQLEPAFSEQVKAGRYKKVSLSLFSPQNSANPAPGTWYPKHVGFLGAAAPAVPGLRNVHFAGGAEDDTTFISEFSVGSEAAGLFRGLRDFLIEKFGLEDADRVLPTYTIQWLADMDQEQSARRSFAAASEAAPTNPPPPKQEVPMSNPSDTQTNEFAARQTAIEAREAALAERERVICHDRNVSFAEELVTEGRLLPASRDGVVKLLDELAALPAASFSAEEGSSTDRLQAILKAQPKVIQFGAAELPGDDGGAAAVQFSADGKAVANGDVHARAVAWQAKHPDTTYLDAVKAVS